MSDIVFNESNHTYTVGGKPVPGVTGIMQPYIGADFSFVDPAVLAAAADLGTRAHAMIHLEATGRLVFNQLDFDVIEYYDSWMEFKEKSGFRVIHSEKRVYSKKHGYCGTLDLFGELNDRLILPDIKRVTSLASSTGPQTAGYLEALLEEHPEYIVGKKVPDRAALQLKPKGKWQLVPLNDPDDFKVFLSCLNIRNHINKGKK